MRERILNHLRNVFDLQQRIQPAIVTLVSVEKIRLALASFTLFIPLTSMWSRSICGDRVHSLYELMPVRCWLLYTDRSIVFSSFSSSTHLYSSSCILSSVSHGICLAFLLDLSILLHTRLSVPFYCFTLTLNVPASPLHLSLVCHPRAAYRYPPPSPPFIFLATSPHSTRLLLFFLLPPHLGRSCFFIKRFECFLLLCSRASHATP